MNFRNWSLSWKIFTLAFLLTFLAILALGLISYFNSRQALHEAQFQKLDALREIRKRQITQEFKLIQNQLLILAHHPTTVEAYQNLEQGFVGLSKSTAAPEERQALRNFYESSFLPAINDHRKTPLALGELLPTQETRVQLQATYIANNPNPAGEKHKLTQAKGTAAYHAAHAKFHPILREFLERNEFHDLFLINLEGDVIYSVYKEVDFATNLNQGLHTNGLFQQVFKKAKAGSAGQTYLVDFAPYWASQDSPAAFMATGLYEGKRLVGVVAIQMPVDRINRIMTSYGQWESTGQGKSGESYLIGEDQTLRSQSRFFLEAPTEYAQALRDAGIAAEVIEKIKALNTTIGLQPVHSQAAEAIAKGQTGETLLEDYRGVSVLSAYTPLEVQGLKWGVIAEIDEEEAFASLQHLQILMLITALVIAGVVLVVAQVSGRLIAKPLVELQNMLSHIAESGDLTQRLNHTSTDEVGRSITSFHSLLERWQKIIQNLHHASQRLNTTASELSQNSRNMAGSSRDLNSRGGTMASASEEITVNVRTVAQASDETAQSVIHVSSSMEELSSNISSISAATEEASVNMNGIVENVNNISQETTTVANAIEELTATMGEISTQTQKAMAQAERANQNSQSNLEIMNHLGDSANRIGKVVKLIGNIASQTNMLALNATIEATNAGTAGKGFAVVAEEVKQLAQESAKANNEIADQISRIQSQINDALTHTEEVSRVILDLNEINKMINKTVAEQNQTAKEVTKSVDLIVRSSNRSAANVSEAKLGVQEIARSVAEASQATKESVDNLSRSTQRVKEIARSTEEASAGLGEFNSNLQEVQQAIRGLNEEIAGTQRSADQLNQMSEEIAELIRIFKI